MSMFNVKIILKITYSCYIACFWSEVVDLGCSQKKGGVSDGMYTAEPSGQQVTYWEQQVIMTHAHDLCMLYLLQPIVVLLLICIVILFCCTMFRCYNDTDNQ